VIKILLVNPSCLDTRISSEDDMVVPIGLYYLGALLIENGFDTQILNLSEYRQNPILNFKNALTTRDFDVIGFSVSNPNRWNAIEAAKLAKENIPDVKIAFGGPCATFLDRHLFKTCPELDFIVKGEGEISFLELVKTLGKKGKQTFDHIRGIVYKKDNTLIQTPQGKPISDLDSLVHPSKHFSFQHLSMSRGCPGNCTFCGSPKFWGKATVRFHSPQWFAKEIEALYHKGIRHFFISDDTFTMDKSRVIELCKIIISKRIFITWNAISRVDYIDKDLLSWMRKAGCIQISFGIESGSKKIRKILGKPINQEKIIQAFQLTASYGILSRAYFIYGSPHEDAMTIKESMELIEKTKPLSCIFYILVLFPGTYLYAQAAKKKLLSDDIWSQKIEDIPWFEIDEALDFKIVKNFGAQLRSFFFSRVSQYAKEIDLMDEKDLYKSHADFLSRMGMTFSHGEYASNNQILNQDKTAKILYNKALSFYPDVRAYWGLSMLFQKKRDFAKAISYLEKGLGHYPENKDLNICMGVCLMNTGQFKNAMGFFEKSKTDKGIQAYINICRQKTTGHSK
jgi:anaerobic magnesium-protoporphyrin IX monomethyl ester cyclase